jgi:hypothetical protein
MWSKNSRAGRLGERIISEAADWFRDEMSGFPQPIDGLHRYIETLIEEAFDEEVRDRNNEHNG